MVTMPKWVLYGIVLPTLIIGVISQWYGGTAPRQIIIDSLSFPMSVVEVATWRDGHGELGSWGAGNGSPVLERFSELTGKIPRKGIL